MIKFDYSKDAWKGYLLWFVIAVLGIALSIMLGCASSQQESQQEEYDLLHRDELLAYKSITIKDYKDNDDECGKKRG